MDLPVLLLTILQDNYIKKASYHTTVYGDLASGTLVTLLRNLFTEAADLLNKLGIESTLWVNINDELYENNLSSFLQLLF
jgi:hypothetical protein